MTRPGPELGDVANAPEAVAQFVALFNAAPTSALIANLRTNVSSATLTGRCYPVTLNDAADAPNCYICCPSTAYIDYAIDETRNFAKSPRLQRAVQGLVRLCAPLVRASGLDHQVQLNNWLYSTNPMPQLGRAEAAEIRDSQIAAHPQRALVIRSLNDIADPASIAALRAEGFRMLAARQIYIFADRSTMPHLTTAMKQDRARLRNGPYCQIGNDAFEEADYPRCEELYKMLYIAKYTPLNPQYTARYIRQMHRRGLLQMAGLRDGQGRLVAVTGLFENGSTLTQPIVGYDTSLPLREGLYRMIMAMGQDHASARGLFFNMSAGAGDFKRRRGAVPAIEYMAVYVRHLPLTRRIAVRIMETVLARVGIPLLRRFEL